MANLLAGMVADLSQVGATNLPYAQLAQQDRQFNQQMKYRREQDEMNALKELGAYTPTGTTWDTYAGKLIQEGKEAYMKRRKENPKEKYTQAIMAQEVQEPLTKVRTYTPIAKTNDLQRIELMKSLKAEYPEIDDAQLANYVAQTQYKDNLPNQNWQTEVDLTPQGLSKFVIPDKAALRMSEGLKKRYATSPMLVEGDPTKGEADYNYNVYPFQEVRDGKVVTPTTEILFGGKPYQLINPETEQYLDKTSPSYYAMYNQAQKEAMQDPMFTQLDEQDQDRLVNKIVFDKTTGALGASRPIPDRTRAMAYQQQRAADLAAKRQADANYIAMRRLALAERKYDDKNVEEKKANTYIGALTKFAEKEPLEESEQNTLAFRSTPRMTEAVLATMPQEFVETFKKDPKNQIKGVELSNNAKNGVLRASDGNFIKSYAWRKGNKEGVVEELWRYDSDLKRYVQDETQKVRVVNTPIKQYLGRFANQIDPKGKNYFEATETIEDAE